MLHWVRWRVTSRPRARSPTSGATRSRQRDTGCPVRTHKFPGVLSQDRSHHAGK